MEWIRGSKIGRGASATVSLATTAAGEVLAVKSTDLSQSASLQWEQHVLSQLCCPYIVKYMGFDVTFESNKPVYNLFMEYVAGGTLSGEIKRRGGSLDESLIRLYTRHVLQGLDYLHSIGMVHCDIKGQNILVSEDGIKIGDLGCARVVDGGSASTGTFSGTPAFMAPEVARGEEQGFPADVWALGCTIIEMATGSNPWPEASDPVSALYLIGFSGNVPELPRWLSEEARDFLSKCLKIDSKERWTAEQLLQHPFVEDLDQMGSVKVNGFAKNSPTGVLDQGFWDSGELPEARRSPSSSFISPGERVRRLIGGTLGSNLPNWTWDDDWITVRSYPIEESNNCSQQNCNLSPDDTQSINSRFFSFLVVNEEQLDNSNVDENLLLECSIERLCNVDSFSDTIDIVMPSESVKNCSVEDTLIYEVNENFLFPPNPCSLSLSHARARAHTRTHADAIAKQMVAGGEQTKEVVLCTVSSGY